MTDDRQEKLNKLQSPAKDVQITINGGSLLDTMNKVDELKSLLGDGVTINNIDELVEQLKEINALEPIVTKLKEAIDGLVIPEMPKDVQIKGLDDLVKVAKTLAAKKDITKIDISTITPITDQVGNLINAIEAIQLPKQGQLPEDFVPMRRVVRMGNKLLYDDSFYTGGGGGGASAVGLLPFVFTSINFSNADANGNYQTGVVKNGGSTVATLTLSYDASSNLTSISRV